MPTDPIEKQHMVTDWLALQRVPESSTEHDKLFWAFGRLCDLCCDAPDEAWDVILCMLAQDHSPVILENLSAGPLEDLLAKHGPTIIDRVEAQARRDPWFARLLGGVWQNAMSPEVWTRVQAVWDRKGWDGIPDS